MTQHMPPCVAGDRVRLIRTTDPHTCLRPCAEGTVTSVDDLGTVHVRWDDGSTLGLVREAGDRWQAIGGDVQGEPMCTGCPDAPDDTPEYRAFEEEQLAIHEGRATQLVRCYMCLPPGPLRMALDAGPLRGIVRRGITNERQDPTTTYELAPCGHTII